MTPGSEIVPSLRREYLHWPVTGRQIDRLVYELYGLMDEEISIVEGD